MKAHRKTGQPARVAPAVLVSEAGAAAEPEELLFVVVFGGEHVREIRAQGADRRSPQDRATNGGSDRSFVGNVRNGISVHVDFVVTVEISVKQRSASANTAPFSPSSGGIAGQRELDFRGAGDEHRASEGIVLSAKSRGPKPELSKPAPSRRLEEVIEQSTSSPMPTMCQPCTFRKPTTS
jgi:hypothetical protein